MGDTLVVTGDSVGYKSTDDGDTWSSVGTINTGSQVRAISYAAALELWAAGTAVGTTIKTAPHPALTPWTNRAGSGVTGINVNRVRWFPDLNGGYFLAGSEGAIASGSSDGITWTTLATLSNPIRDFAYSPALDRAVSVADVASSGPPRSAEGTDLTTWTARTGHGFSTANGNGASWSPSQAVFVMVGGGNSQGPKVATSTDGITWTPRTAPALTEIRSVEWVEDLSLFVAVGDAGIATSPTGVTWTVQSSVTGFVDVVWAPTSQQVVALTSGGNIYRSADAVTWTGPTSVGIGTSYGIDVASSVSGWLVGSVPIFA